MRQIKTHGISRRLTAALLCLCLVSSLISGAGVMTAFAADPVGAEPRAAQTEKVVSGSRVADPDTMDSYRDLLITAGNGSRYAGRVWTDKTVFAYGDTARANSDTNSSHFNGSNTITLDMATDGYTGNVKFNADFGHVFSALASSQVVNEYPPSPIDMVLVLDVSSSMGQATEPAAGNMFAEILDGLTTYFNSTEGRERINADTRFRDYYAQQKGEGDTNAKTLAEFALEQTFEHTRFLNLIYSANRVIEQLMTNNPENRVSVVVYDRRATVIMPLAHYTANDKPLSEIGKNDVYDTSYLGKSPSHSDPATQIISGVLNDEVFGYLAPFFDGHDGGTDASSYNGHHPTDYVEVEQATVVATAKDTVDAAGNPIEVSNITGSMRVAGTNTHAGITAGMEQLANAKDTTLTAKLSDGSENTVARIPALIVMTDGGSNTVANGPWYDPDYDTPVQRSDYKNEWSSVVVTQYLLTAAYLKSAIEKNYDKYMALSDHQDLPVYTVGVDLRDDTDSWVPGRLYPMMDPAKYFTSEDLVPDEVPNPSAESGSIPLKSDKEEGKRSNEGIIGNAYQNWTEWSATADAEVTMQFPFAHWSDGDHIAKGRFQQKDSTTWQGVYYNNYIIPFEQDQVNSGGSLTEGTVKYYRNATEQVNPTVYYNQLWHGWDGATVTGNAGETLLLWDADKNNNLDNPFNSAYDDDALGTATFWSFDNALKTAGETGGDGTPYNVGGKNYVAKYLAPRVITNDDAATGEAEHTNTRAVAAVTQQDMVDNINYVTKFYDVSSAEMDSIFEEILKAVLGEVFVPISGDNDAGVGDSITYQDPIGEYMEIKNGAVKATPHHVTSSPVEETEQDYDMAMLLFGEMHGLVRVGVYDWNWNDTYMNEHGLEAGSTAFPMGWYWGDDPAAAQKADDGTNIGYDGAGTYPLHSVDGLNTKYNNANDARADGWVFRVNYSTLLSFVPITGVDLDDASVHPSTLPDQVKNTVYTLYRFAGSQDDRNALHRNPIYGEVPQDIKDAWQKAYNDSAPKGGTKSYPVDNDIYAGTPGVYRLSDIRVWVEDTGDFVDTTGAITPNTGYDRSLYVDIPAAAVPTELATITLGADGVLSYETNLGSDHEKGTFYGKNADGTDHEVTEDDYKNFCYQSTPLRLFYAVGLEEDLILRDDSGNQTGVDFNAISPEYIRNHTVEGQDYVWFISNYYSNTQYDSYTADTETSRTRGDPTVTFSPSSANRYYVFQKPLPLYAHAYRVQDGGTLKPVDNNVGTKWTEANNRAGNGSTYWENEPKSVVTNTPVYGGGSWGGGTYMGTYKSADSFKIKYDAAISSNADTITDDHGITYELIEPDGEGKNGGIVFLEEDLLEHVTSQATGSGYESGSVSFSSNDYFFLLIEYYLPDDTVGVDENDTEVPGTHGGKMVQQVVTRKGSEFGSAFESDLIDNGDMLCWTDMNGEISVEFDYLSKTDTGDLTRGEPTFEKLTLKNDVTDKALENYLIGIGIQNTPITIPNPDNPEETISSTILQEQVKYWLALQDDPQIKAALNNAKEVESVSNHDEVLNEAEFNAYFRFAVAARPGGIRSGDMANNIHTKGEKYNSTTALFNDNVTGTANSYYLPTVSGNSGTDNEVILNTYLGNNGYMEIANQMLHVTKMLELPAGYTLTDAQKTEEFNYQIFVQGVSGKRTAARTEYNEYSGSWERRLAYIDVLTDNSDLVQTNDSTRALFVMETATTSIGTGSIIARQVVQGEDNNYYYANDDGTQSNTVVSENPTAPTLYYMYLPSNGTEGTNTQHVYRLYQAEGYKGEDAEQFTNLNKNGTTTFVDPGQHEITGTEPGVGNTDSYRQADEKQGRPAGTRTYWAQDAELIPKSEVDAAEADNLLMGAPGEPGGIATMALESISGGTWTHTAHAGGEGNHKDLTFHTFVIRKPNDETSATDFTSPFATRSAYMTVELNFGQNANDDGVGSTEAGQPMAEGDLYDSVIPGDDRPDLFGSLDAATIAASTAEFTLHHGEGLLLTGLDNRVAYRFTEKLTEAQLAAGYTLQEVSHVQQRGSDSIYRPGMQKIPIYTQEGATYGEQYAPYASNKTENGLTWAVDTNGTKNTTEGVVVKNEPFAHTNAIMWEYYATMANGASGNHHQPTSVADDKVEKESSMQIWDGSNANTYTDTKQPHTVADNPNCKDCDKEQEDGTILHYMYREGKLIDPHYNGEASTYMRNMARYGVSPTVHFAVQNEPSTATVPSTQDGTEKYTGVYSVFGNTGWFEEQAKFINTFEPGTLSITKELEAATGTEITEQDKQTKFDFTLKLEQSASVAIPLPDTLNYTITGPGASESVTGKLSAYASGGNAPDANGVYAIAADTWVFQLKGGQTMTVDGLPAGTDYTYTVTEAAVSDGYTVTDKVEPDNTGNTSHTDKIVSGKVTPGSEDPVQVTFTNTKQPPKPATIGLDLTKTVNVANGTYTLNADDFSFVVTPALGNPTDDPIKEQDGWSDTTNTLTVNNGASADGKTATAVILPDTTEFNNVGTYRYTVHEFVPETAKPGVSYDGSVYNVTIDVTVDYGTDPANPIYQGRLKAVKTVTKAPNVSVEAIAFTNEYDESKVSVPFFAQKYLKDETGQDLQLESGRFEFRLEPYSEPAGISTLAISGDIPLPSPEINQPEGAVVQRNTDGGVVNFGSATYTEPGTYRYRITETAESESGIIYDDAVYIVTVTVSQDSASGALVAEVEYTDAAGTAHDEAVFTNHRSTPKPEYGELTVSKTVTGSGDTAKDFLFTVTFTAPEGTVDWAAVTTGTFSTGSETGHNVSWTGTEGNILTFTLKHGESVTVSGLPAGTAYTVAEEDYTADGYTTTVTDGDGTAADGSGTVAAGDKDAVAFVNHKDEPKPEKVSLRITKTVTGAEGDKNAEWEFYVDITIPEGSELTDVQILKGGADTEIRFIGTGLAYTNENPILLKSGESAEIVGLPVGTLYSVREMGANSDGYTTEKTNDTGAITDGTTAEVAFVNSRGEPEPETGSLTVTKEVTGDGDTAKEFNFTVTFNAPAGETVDWESIPMTFSPASTDPASEHGVARNENVLTFTLKHNESVTIIGLPVGTEYTVTEDDYTAEEYTASVTDSDSPDDGSGVIEANATDTVAFINDKPTTPPPPPPSSENYFGNLVVTKTVTGEGDATQEFHFAVTLGSRLNGRYGDMIFRSGVAEFTLKHGESAAARNLPAGVTYAVTEAEANADGYTTTSTGDAGTIPNGGTARAAFVNGKNPPPPEDDSGNLTVTKTVTGSAGDTTKEWHFTVTLDDTGVDGAYGDMTFTNGVAAFTLKHGESRTATGLPAGVTYTVTEQEANEDGYTTTASGVSGTITDGGTGYASFVNDRNEETPPPPTSEEPPTEPPTEPPVEQPPTEQPPTEQPPVEPPKTGEGSHPGLWMTLLILSLAGVAVTSTSLFGKRQRQADCRGKYLKK